MPFLVVDGFTVDVTVLGGAQQDELLVGDRARGFDGTARTSRRASMRAWRLRTGPLSTADFSTLRSKLLGTPPLLCSGDLFGGGNMLCDPELLRADYIELGGASYRRPMEFTLHETVFLPTALTGCVLWLAADLITGLADAAAVGTWADASGKANDATQATAADKPTYKTGILNSKPVVRFDGTDYLTIASALGLNGSDKPCTIITVAETDSFAATRTLFSLGNSANDTVQHNQNYITTPLFRVFRQDDAAASKSASSGAAPAANTWYIFAERFSGTLCNLYVNGALDGSADQDLDVGACTFNQSRVGARASQTLANQHLGDIAEVIVYDRALSVAELDKVEAALGLKYAITIS